MSQDVGKVLEGKYELVRQIGEGGMGSVYEAEHTVIHRRMAVKLLHRQFTHNDIATERFIREAQAASAIGHKNIVEVQDVGETDDGRVFIVMEMLEGVDLTTLIQREGKLDPGRAVEITRQLLSGLKAAHDLGVIHRDLKPDNIILVENGDGAETVKILDFGISKILTEQEVGLTHTGAILGTPFYMAPEQARGEKEIDERIDIWAVGVMLYVMLCGELPYFGENYNEVISQVLLRPVPPLRERLPTITDELDAVIAKALAKDRDERYREVDELAADLEAVERYTTDGPERLRAAEEAEIETEPGVATGRGKRYGSWLQRLGAVALAWLMWLPALSQPELAYLVMRLPRTWSRGVARLMLVAGALAMTMLGLVVARLVKSVPPDRWWRRGAGLLALPAAAVALVAFASAQLAGDLDAHLLPLRHHVAVGVDLAPEVSRLLAAVHADSLLFSAVACISIAFIVLVLIANPGNAEEARFDQREPSRWRWFILPAGLFVVILAEGLGPVIVGAAGDFPRRVGDVGYLRLIAYGLWIAVAFLALRAEGSADQTEFFPAPRRLVVLGAIGAGALLANQVIMGYVKCLDLLQHTAEGGIWVERREYEMQLAQRAVATGAVVDALVLLVLFGGLYLRVGRPSKNEKPPLLRSLLRGGVLVLVAGLSVAPTWVLTQTMSRLSRVYLPHRAKHMQPVAGPDDGEPFYLDRHPQSLRPGRDALWSKLKKKPRRDYKSGALLEVLSGRKACTKILKAALRKRDPAPARCITGIEARFYCESLGKRLATPEEWDSAFSVGAKKSGPTPGRGSFGEWTMHIVQGTPTFVVRGTEASRKVPKKLGPDAFSPYVGFRCAWRFTR